MKVRGLGGSGVVSSCPRTDIPKRRDNRTGGFDNTAIYRTGATDARSRLVRADDVFDLRPAQGALTPALPPPLLHRAPITHTHVPAHVQHAIYWVLVAYRAFGARRTLADDGVHGLVLAAGRGQTFHQPQRFRVAVRHLDLFVGAILGGGALNLVPGTGLELLGAGGRLSEGLEAGQTDLRRRLDRLETREPKISAGPTVERDRHIDS